MLHRRVGRTAATTRDAGTLVPLRVDLYSERASPLAAEEHRRRRVASGSTHMRFIVIGIVIALVGGVGLYFGGLPYTDREQVLDVGPLEATAEMRKKVEIPPLLSGGILALGVGIAVYGAGRKR